MQQNKSLVPLLVALYGGAFLAGFNENLMNMALMSIMSDYGIDSVVAQWTVTGYMIVATVVVMSMAFMFRRIKLRSLYFAAAGFTFIGSLIGLFAANFPILMLGRVVQAVGSGIFIPLMMNTVLAVTPKNRIGTYLSIGSCMITFGPALAPVVCGGMVTAFGWHAIFVVPLVAMVVLGAVAVPSVHNLENFAAQLDLPSVVLSALFLTGLSLGLVQLTINTQIAVAALVVAALSAIVFVVRQSRCENPLIDLTPMKSRAFWPSIVLTTIAMMGSFSCSVLLPLYLEGALGLTAFVSGLIILVPVLGNAGTSLLGGRIMDKRGEWPLLPTGYAVVAVGFALMALFSQQMSLPMMFIGAFLAMGGTGLIFSPSQSAGFKTLTPEQNPFGVALSTTFVQIAACVAPSLYTGILSSAQANALAGGATEAMAMAVGFSMPMTVASFVAAAGCLIGFAYSRAAVKRAAVAKAQRASEPAADRPLARLVQPEPYTLPASAPVYEAMRLFVDRKVGGMPLVDDDGHPAGFVSDGDVMRFLADKQPVMSSAYALVQAANNQTLDERMHELMHLPVSQIATSKLVSLDADSSFEEACSLLASYKLKKVPVVRDGEIVGTINRSDIIRYAMERSLANMG